MGVSVLRRMSRGRCTIVALMIWGNHAALRRTQTENATARVYPRGAMFGNYKRPHRAPSVSCQTPLHRRRVGGGVFSLSKERQFCLSITAFRHLFSCRARAVVCQRQAVLGSSCRSIAAAWRRVIRRRSSQVGAAHGGKRLKGRFRAALVVEKAGVRELVRLGVA